MTAKYKKDSLKLMKVAYPTLTKKQLNSIWDDPEMLDKFEPLEYIHYDKQYNFPKEYLKPLEDESEDELSEEEEEEETKQQEKERLFDDMIYETEKNNIFDNRHNKFIKYQNENPGVKKIYNVEPIIYNVIAFSFDSLKNEPLWDKFIIFLIEKIVISMQSTDKNIQKSTDENLIRSRLEPRINPYLSFLDDEINRVKFISVLVHIISNRFTNTGNIFKLNKEYEPNNLPNILY